MRYEEGKAYWKGKGKKGGKSMVEEAEEKEGK